MFRLIIAGGRDFTNYALMKKVLDNLLRDPTVTKAIQLLGGLEIVSGKQVSKPSSYSEREDESKWWGADWLGEKYAKENTVSI